MRKNQEISLPQYRITLLGHLPHHWTGRFKDMEIQNEPDGTTTLTGIVVDQAALYGLIIQCRDMGLTLLEIIKTPPHGKSDHVD